MGGNLHRSWCDQQTVTLLRLRREGFDVVEIGKRMSRSKNSIAGRLFRLGLSAKKVERLAGAPLGPVDRAAPARSFAVDYSTGQPQIIAKV